jgi:DNA-binding NarL/FixJ family response regulator
VDSLPVRVLVVEDEPRFRSNISRSIRADSSFELVAACADAGEALAVIEREPIDVELVDLHLPDRPGLEVIKATKQRRPSCDVMVISTFGDEELVLAAIEAGATGYLLKDSLPAELVACVHDLRKGGAPMSPMVARLLLDRVRSGGIVRTDTQGEPPNGQRAPAFLLSDRETEILRAIAKGFNFVEIANYFSISVNTVKTHVRRTYRKLAVTSRSEAVYEAHYLGLLDPIPRSGKYGAGSDANPTRR